jgi:Sec-independent protein translocase protein TatA
MALTTHSFKAGSRVLINTSPEPVTNWTASIAEDLAVFAGLWTALNHPALFIIFLIVFILFAIWVLPKLWRGIKAVFRAIGRFFSGKSEEPSTGGFDDLSENLSRSETLSESVLKMEYKKKK